MLTTAIVGLISAATAVIWAYKDSHASMHRCDPEQDVLGKCQRMYLSMAPYISTCMVTVQYHVYMYQQICRWIRV